MDHKKYSRLIIPLAAALAVFSIFLYTAPSSVYHGDDGETITDSVTLGIQHPPGYPLHTMLGRLFSMVPAGDFAFRIYLMSMFFCLGNFMLIYFIFLRLAPIAGIKPGSLLSFSFASILFAAGFTVWEQAIIAKGSIYMLNVFFMLALSLITIEIYLGSKGWRKLFYLFCFTYGLSLAHHHMSQEILLPAYAFLLFKSGVFRKLSLKNYVTAALLLASGLACYLYLPLRSESALINWGEPNTFQNFIRIVTRWQYLRSELTRSLTGSIAQSVKFFSSTSYEYAYAGVLFILIGMAVFYKREKNLFIFLVSIPALFLFIITVYLNLTEDKLYIMDTYITPVYFPLSVFAAAGIIAVSSKLSDLIKVHRGAIETSIFLAILAGQVLIFFPLLDKSRYFMAYDYNTNILNSLEPNSVVFITGDGVVFPLWYMKYVKNMRPDVTIIGTAVLPMKWVRDSITRQNPSFRMPQIRSDNIGTESTGYIMNAMIKMNMDRFPFYLSYNKPEENSMTGGYVIMPKGVVQKIMPAQYAFASGQYLAMQKNLWQFYNYRGCFGESKKYVTKFADRLYIKDYSISLNSAGTFLEEQDLNIEALGFFARAHRMVPDDHEFIYNMGNAYYHLGDRKTAIERYRECVSMEPKYESGWFNLAVACYKEVRYKEALEAFRMVKKINPARTDIDSFISVLEKATGGN